MQFFYVIQTPIHTGCISRQTSNSRICYMQALCNFSTVNLPLPIQRQPKQTRKLTSIKAELTTYVFSIHTKHELYETFVNCQMLYSMAAF